MEDKKSGRRATNYELEPVEHIYQQTRKRTTKPSNRNSLPISIVAEDDDETIREANEYDLNQPTTSYNSQRTIQVSVENLAQAGEDKDSKVVI
jgi:hypothetical protein